MLKKEKDNKNLQEVKKIWDGSNWKSYTECANEIHRNQLIEEENYRKIYDLVSKAAKMKNNFTSAPHFVQSAPYFSQQRSSCFKVSKLKSY
ncbi:hypothetical protein AB3538_13840 [Acinetobacter baumannii]